MQQISTNQRIQIAVTSVIENPNGQRVNESPKLEVTLC